MTHSPDLRGSLRLDGHHGPASRISRLRAAEMIEKAMESADAPSLPLRRKRRFAWPSSALLVPVAAAVPLALMAGAAAYFVSMHHGGLAKVAAEPARGAALAPARGADASLSASGDRPAPESMLEKANELRAKGEWLAATELYEGIAQQFPSSKEAYRAMIGAGLLRLERLGDAEGAARLLSAAVAQYPTDDASREARWGRIEALRALDDRAEERRSLIEFVSLYSEGPLPALARERLTRLSE